MALRMTELTLVVVMSDVHLLQETSTASFAGVHTIRQVSEFLDIFVVASLFCFRMKRVIIMKCMDQTQSLRTGLALLT